MDLVVYSHKENIFPQVYDVRDLPGRKEAIRITELSDTWPLQGIIKNIFVKIVVTSITW